MGRLYWPEIDKLESLTDESSSGLNRSNQEKPSYGRQRTGSP
jgi:hypothetical protein